MSEDDRDQQAMLANENRPQSLLPSHPLGQALAQLPAHDSWPFSSLGTATPWGWPLMPALVGVPRAGGWGFSWVASAPLSSPAPLQALIGRPLASSLRLSPLPTPGRSLGRGPGLADGQVTCRGWS